jgi:hypothetical protein
MRLAQAITRFEVPGRYAVAVTDLQTGDTIAVNGERPQRSGCSINLYVLLLVTLDLQDGRYPVEQVDEIMSTTTWSSDAEAAHELYSIAGDGNPVAGVRRTQDLIESLGMTDSSIDHPPLFSDVSLGDGAGNLITAKDANRSLLSIWQGDLLRPRWRDFLLAKLATVKPGLNYILGTAPIAVVSHKNGFFEDEDGFVDNDLGIVRLSFSDGSEAVFAMSFLSEAVTTKYSEVPLAQELVKLAAAYFREAYGPGADR